MKFSIHFEFYKERQVYYHMMPVIWRPDWLSRGLMFEFLRYRAIVWTSKSSYKSNHHLALAIEDVELDASQSDNPDEKKTLNTIASSQVSGIPENDQGGTKGHIALC